HRPRRARRADRRGARRRAGAGEDARGAGAGRHALREGSGREGARHVPRGRPAPRERSGDAPADDRGPHRRREGVSRKEKAALHRPVVAPCAYYARLTGSQQAVYRKSDALVEIRLENPASLYPQIAALEAALNTEERAATERASHELVAGLTEAMGLPAVRVEVLAARPHSRWGELHGLYTQERGRKPKIQLWMRTAKMKRVVAFRSYLRTLLHEVGHHVDYTGLRLPESYHTQGFYKRESSLFHQLVPEARGTLTMATMEEYAKLPADERMRRLSRTADELGAAIRGRDDAILSRRPDAKNWAAKEAICHLRDVEEMFIGRFGMILAMDH